MTLIVEDGTGIYLANAYVNRGYVASYLASRNRSSSWASATDAQKDAAIIAATDYIDTRFGHHFLGERRFTDLEVAAWNILQVRTNPQADDTVTIGSVTYTFKASAATANEVTIGATAADSAQSLLEAINGVGGGSGTTAHPDAAATASDSAGDVIVRAKVAGALDTAITCSSSTTRMVWDYDELIGGKDQAEQQLQFPRLYLYTRGGIEITGIPEGLKKAVSEYAIRAITETLMPDPTTDATGQMVVKTFDKVGPIETEREYIGGSQMQIYKKYPAADMLLLDYLKGSGGGVIR